jgi:hypothetical protein
MNQLELMKITVSIPRQKINVMALFCFSAIPLINAQRINKGKVTRLRQSESACLQTLEHIIGKDNW